MTVCSTDGASGRVGARTWSVSPSTTRIGVSRLSTRPLKNAGERHFVRNMRMKPRTSDPTDSTKMPPVCQPNRVIWVYESSASALVCTV